MPGAARAALRGEENDGDGEAARRRVYGSQDGRVTSACQPQPTPDRSTPRVSLPLLTLLRSLSLPLSLSLSLSLSLATAFCVLRDNPYFHELLLLRLLLHHGETGCTPLSFHSRRVSLCQRWLLVPSYAAAVPRPCPSPPHPLTRPTLITCRPGQLHQRHVALHLQRETLTYPWPGTYPPYDRAGTVEGIVDEGVGAPGVVRAPWTPNYANASGRLVRSFVWLGPLTSLRPGYPSVQRFTNKPFHGSIQLMVKEYSRRPL